MNEHCVEVTVPGWSVLCRLVVPCLLVMAAMVWPGSGTVAAWAGTAALVPAVAGEAETAGAVAPNLPGVINVGVVVTPPFLKKDDQGRFSGLAYDLWGDVARTMGLRWEVKEYDLDGLVRGLRDGSVDVGVAALSITPERESEFDFSQPYYYTGLGIAVPSKSSGDIVTGVGRALFSSRLLVYLGSLLVLILVVGALVWMVERRRNPDNFRPGCSGLGDGMWWSAVTMTAVGYGDTTPKTLAGRVLGFVWMFASVVLLATFTAGVTSSLTVANIGGRVQGPDDLDKVRTGVMADTSAQEELLAMHIAVRRYPDVQAGLKALVDGSIDAFVHDQPILRYYAHNDEAGNVRVLPAFFDPQLYGFGFPRGSTLRKAVNVVMLRLLENYDYRTRLFGPYFGRSNAQ